MVEKYQKKFFLDVFNFLKNNRNSDFYYTKENQRYFINTEVDLTNFLRQVSHVYVIQKRGDIQGVIALWSSISVTGKRFFVKMNAIDNYIANRLLTIILWNFFRDLYIKIHKTSKNLSVFYNKGFKFIGFRGKHGKEFLLYRQKSNPSNIEEKEEENSNERINNKIKN